MEYQFERKFFSRKIWKGPCHKSINHEYREIGCVKVVEKISQDLDSVIMPESYDDGRRGSELLLFPFHSKFLSESFDLKCKILLIGFSLYHLMFSLKNKKPLLTLKASTKCMISP